MGRLLHTTITKTMIPHYRPAVAGDEQILAPKLRQQDVDEVKASSGLDPLEALQISCLLSVDCNAIIAGDGELIGLFGVTKTPDPFVGCPWLLASDRLPEIRKEFLPQSYEWVQRINKQFPVLRNYVDKRNTKAIRWLKYLGFQFIDLVEDYGVGKKPFYEFVRIEADNV